MSDLNKCSLSSDNVLFVHYHGLQYADFDFFISDINKNTLESLGKLTTKVNNLSVATFPTPAFPVEGIIHTTASRFMIPLVVQQFDDPESEPLYVWFLVNTASPFTCLTADTFKALAVKNLINPESDYSDEFCCRMAIQERIYVECNVSKGHFKEVNILGNYVLERLNLSMDINWRTYSFKLIKKERELLHNSSPKKKVNKIQNVFDRWLSKLRRKT